MDYFLLVVGLAVLIAGGEILVKGAVGFALKFKVSVLVVGMTVVSFGTSAPELLISIKAVMQDLPDISLGNVIGSNIANISLILGLTTIIFPILVGKDSLRTDWPMMIIASIVFWFFILNGKIGFFEGLFLFLLLAAFNAFLIIRSRKKHREHAVDEDEELQPGSSMSMKKSIVFIVFGCLGLAFGADWFLSGAVSIAESFGVSPRIIALTLVAFGTSIPELITSVIAALKKETDISIGNLIGSNVFNLLGIIGITGMVKTIPVSEKIMNFDTIWMMAVSFGIFPLMYFGRKIGRLKGSLLFVFYITYIFFVFYLNG